MLGALMPNELQQKCVDQKPPDQKQYEANEARSAIDDRALIVLSSAWQGKGDTEELAHKGRHAARSLRRHPKLTPSVASSTSRNDDDA
jgi:hypothetical protein